MSEAEKKRRLEYKQNRKKWIFIQLALLLVALVFAGATFGVYSCLNKTLYINYNENSKIDYKVKLKDNDFYEDELLDKNGSYVATLIDNFSVDFNYGLSMNTKSVDFEYKYQIEAVTEVVDTTSGAVIYQPKDVLVPETVKKVSGNTLNIFHNVKIDYHNYNNKAQTFINVYGLKNVRSNLLVRMVVDVKGASEQFSSDSKNHYVFTFNAPLVQQTVNVVMSSTVPQTENVILARSEVGSQDLLKTCSLVGVCVFGVLGIVLIAFIYLTRNTDINYDIQVGKLVKNYRSYIQKIVNPFDDKGYQVLKLSSFTEMLEIRDTIQSPILMFENGDKTCTQFIIPTNTKIIYYFDIKVADYDDIYGTTVDVDNVLESLNNKKIYSAQVSDQIVATSTAEVQEQQVEQPQEEQQEEVVEEVVEEVEVQAEQEIETEEEQLIDQSSEFSEVGGGINIDRKYKYTFSARLIQSENTVKEYYSEVKNELLSYKKTKAKTSANYEAYNKGREHLAKINVRGKTLYLYLALDPKDYADTKYFPTDVSDVVRYNTVPMRVKVKSERGVKYAKELIALVAEKFGLVKNDAYVYQNFAPKYQSTAQLVKAGLIKYVGGQSEVLPIQSKTSVYEIERKYRHSFSSRLIQADKQIKEFYSDIKNELLSYKKVKDKTSANYEAYYSGRQHLAKINVRGKTVYVYFALDPKDYADTKYFPTDVSNVSRYSTVPMRVKVKSERGVKYAKELIAVIAEKFGLTKNDAYVYQNFAPKSQSTSQLVKKGLIKDLSGVYSAIEESEKVLAK